MKYSEKKGTLIFFVPLADVSQNFQKDNETQITHFLPFVAPSKRVLGRVKGVSWDQGAAV